MPGTVGPPLTLKVRNFPSHAVESDSEQTLIPQLSDYGLPHTHTPSPNLTEAPDATQSQQSPFLLAGAPLFMSPPHLL